MLDRELHLLAIAAAPADDLPRLVFADWLDDRGDPDLAELVRIEREYLHTLATAGVFRLIDCLNRRLQLLAAVAARTGSWPGQVERFVRGLFRPEPLTLNVAQLTDPDGLRLAACTTDPGWYAATRLTVSGGLIVEPTPLDTVFASPVTARVTDLILAGWEEWLGRTHDEALGLALTDFAYRPVVTSRMVAHLCGLREARRLVALDLTRNNLDNDAVRALARSTNLIRLRDLRIQEGNGGVKGRVWSELLERFGPEVVR